MRWGLLTILVASVMPLPAALTADQAEALLAEANQAFREANEIAESNPGLARDGYQRAALRFERLVSEGGIENGKLYYNLANAYFRLGDMGRAILNYRRAGRLRPFDDNIRQNLRYVRGRTADQLGTVGPNSVAQVLLFWHYGLTPRWRQLLFGLAWVAGWVLLLVPLVTGGRRRFAGAPWCFAAAGLFGASLAWDAWGGSGLGDGVVIQERTTARKGDGDSYQAAFSEPLHAGTEFQARERRGDWVRVELADGRECWLRAGAVGFVIPPA